MTVLIDRGGGTKRPPPPDKKSPFPVLLYYGLRFAQTYPSSCHNEAAGEGKAPPPPPTHPPIFHFLLLSLPSSVRAVNSVLHDKASAAATLFSGGWIQGAANGEGMGGNPFFLRRQSAACRREGANSTEEGPTVTFISSPCLHVTFMRYHKLTKTKYFLVHRKYENIIIGLSSLEYHRNKRIHTEEGNGENTQRGICGYPRLHGTSLPSPHFPFPPPPPRTGAM